MRKRDFPLCPLQFLSTFCLRAWHHGLEALGFTDTGSHCHGKTTKIGPRCLERGRVATSSSLGQKLNGQHGMPSTKTAGKPSRTSRLSPNLRKRTCPSSRCCSRTTCRIRRPRPRQKRSLDHSKKVTDAAKAKQMTETDPSTQIQALDAMGDSPLLNEQWTTLEKETENQESGGFGSKR